MSGFNLNLTVDDLGVRAAAQGLRDLGADLRGELMVPIGMALESSTLERFETGTAPDGQPWALSYRAKITGGLTLVDSGSYRDSYHHVAEDAAVEIGSADIRAPALNFGAVIQAKGDALTFRLADGGWRSAKSVTIPARPVVGLSAEDGVTVVALGEAALSRAVGGAA